MTSSALPMPPLRIVERRLRAITEHLASELSCPTPTAPAWNELDWRLAQAVAAMHGVAPLLATALRWEGPKGWRQYLEEQLTHTRLREDRLIQLLEQIDSQMRHDGIAIVPLKGSALRALGLYAPGERLMADIDLLVHPEDMNAAARALQALGYREWCITPRHRCFAAGSLDARSALGEHAQNPLKIELHERLTERLPLAETEITALVLPDRAHHGSNGYPSRAALLVHVMLHAAGNIVHRSVRLVHLIDIARLAARMTDADWSELVAYGGEERRLWWAAAPLMLTARYFQNALPRPILARFAADCPWLLARASRHRSLSDASYSDPMMAPLPGIAWSRSLGELARYVANRVRPSPQWQAQSAVLAQSYPWSTESPWLRRTHVQRILGWLSRPMRLETRISVQAALAPLSRPGESA
jgi:hypothetical protein